MIDDHENWSCICADITQASSSSSPSPSSLGDQSPFFQSRQISPVSGWHSLFILSLFMSSYGIVLVGHYTVYDHWLLKGYLIWISSLWPKLTSSNQFSASKQILIAKGRLGCIRELWAESKPMNWQLTRIGIRHHWLGIYNNRILHVRFELKKCFEKLIGLECELECFTGTGTIKTGIQQIKCWQSAGNVWLAFQFCALAVCESAWYAWERLACHIICILEFFSSSKNRTIQFKHIGKVLFAVRVYVCFVSQINHRTREPPFLKALLFISHVFMAHVQLNRWLPFKSINVVRLHVIVFPPVLLLLLLLLSTFNCVKK